MIHYESKLLMGLMLAPLIMGIIAPQISYAQAVREFKVIEGAIESPAVQLVFDSDGVITEVIEGACPGCERQSFEPAPGMVIEWGGKEVPLPTVKGLNGQPATVIYNLDSNAVTSINFFKRGE